MVKHLEVPEVDTTQVVDIKQVLNIDYIVVPTREAAIRTFNNYSVIQDCHSELVVSTETHIAIKRS